MCARSVAASLPEVRQMIGAGLGDKNGIKQTIYQQSLGLFPLFESSRGLGSSKEGL